MDAKRLDYLLKKVLGRDFFAACKAVAELRRDQDASVSEAIASLKVKDEQRAFQCLIATIVLNKGISGLAEKWSELPDTVWRETLLRDCLLSEFSNHLDQWVDESTIDLFIRAVDDPDVKVSGRAVIGLRECLAPLSKKEQTAMAKTISGKARLDAKLKLNDCVTSERRRRITAAILGKLKNHQGDPRQIPWFDWHVEVLGYVANRNDGEVIEVLTGFSSIAGEPFTTSYSEFDPNNLPWPDKLLAEKKGVTPTLAIRYTPTGLLDINLLNMALRSINQREP
jgi:hypothetical protein